MCHDSFHSDSHGSDRRTSFDPCYDVRAMSTGYELIAFLPFLASSGELWGKFGEVTKRCFCSDCFIQPAELSRHE